VHSQAASAGQTDWPQIAALYLGLELLLPTNPVRLSRAVAVAEAYGAQRGLGLMRSLDEEHQLGTDPLVRQRFLAARAHLRERVGEDRAAALDYRRAAELTANQAEQDYLHERAAACEADPEVDPPGQRG
jgi:predicted RNA polymerase sigma factor